MTRHPVYRALHVPKTLWGIDVKLLAYAGGLGLVVFNLFQSALFGLFMTGIGYGLIRIITAREPRMIEILWTQRPTWLGGVAGQARYDAARWGR